MGVNPVEVRVLFPALTQQGLRANRPESFIFGKWRMGTKWGHDCVSVEIASLVLSDDQSENRTMASLEQRNGNYRVVFRLNGDKFSRSLHTDNETAATASLARLEDNLRRVELGTLSIPVNADIPTFLLSDARSCEAGCSTAVHFSDGRNGGVHRSTS